jgi:hypothetical protein
MTFRSRSIDNQRNPISRRCSFFLRSPWNMPRSRQRIPWDKETKYRMMKLKIVGSVYYNLE